MTAKTRVRVSIIAGIVCLMLSGAIIGKFGYPIIESILSLILLSNGTAILIQTGKLIKSYELLSDIQTEIEKRFEQEKQEEN